MARGDQNTVITIQLQADAKGVDAVFNLTQKNAERLGKAIGNALAFDNRKTATALNSVNEDLKKLATSAAGLRNAFKSFADFPYKQTNANLQSVAKQLGLVQDKAVSANKALRDVKFLIGDSNKNIRSVITQLERLEKVANRIGARKIQIDASTGGTTTGGSSKSRTATTTSTTTSTHVPTIGVRGSGDSYHFESVVGNGPGARGGGGNYRPTFIPEKFFTDAGKASGQKFNDEFVKAVKSIDTKLESVAKQGGTKFSRLFSANLIGDFVSDSIQGAIRSIKDITLETVTYAARTQELGIVLNSLAKVNNISTQEISRQEQAMKSLNITTQDTRETLSRFIAVGFDVKTAGPLSRVAQDLAVLGGLNTSEAVDKLVVAIQTLQSRNLRSVGVYLTVDEVLDKLSNTTGRARDSFTTLEKQQAVLNAVMQYGSRVAGTYEASMTSASKQLRSMDRLWREAQNALGENFIPVMQVLVESTNEFLEGVAKYPGIFTRMAATVGIATAAFVALKTNIIQTAALGTINFGEGLLASFTGRQTAQAELNLLKREEQRLHREGINLQVQALDIEIARLTATKGRTYALREQNALQLAQVKNQREQLVTQGNVFDANTKKGSIASTVSGAIGKIAIIGTVALLAYDIITGINDVLNAPRDVKGADINSAYKNLKDLQTAQANLSNFQEANTAKLTASSVEYNQVQGNVQEANNLLEIYNRIAASDLSLETFNSIEEQNKQTQIQVKTIESLNNNDRIRLETLKLQKGVTGEMLTDLQQTLEVERQRAQLKIDEQLGASRGNFRNAFLNLNDVLNEGRGRSERRRTLEEQIKAGKPLIEPVYNAKTGLQTGEKVTPVSSLVNELNRLDSESTEYTKKQTDALDKFKNQYSELAKFSSIYGLNFKEQLNSATLGINENALAFGNLREAVKYTKTELESLLKPLASSLLTGEQKGKSLAFDYYKGLADSLNNEKTAIDARLNELKSQIGINITQEQYDEVFNRDYSPEAVQNIIKNATDAYNKSFGAGQSGEERRKLLADQLNTYIKEEEKASGKTYKGLERNVRLLEIYREKASTDVAFKAYSSALSSTDQLNAELEETIDLLELFNSSADPTLRKSRVKLSVLRFGDPENRQKLFESEAIDEQTNSLTEYLKLRYKLYGEVKNDDVVLKGSYQTVVEGVRALKEEEQIREKIRDASRQQKAVEDEIRVLRETSSIPLVQTELLIQKQILESVQERKKAEQQLTIDIATEIYKRRNAYLDYNSTVAQVFLDSQKSKRQTEEDAFKSVLNYNLKTGDTSVFADNPLIREAVKQSEKMAEIEAAGGVQVVKIEEGNKILLETQKINSDNNKITQEAGTAIVSSVNGLKGALSNINIGSVAGFLGNPYGGGGAPVPVSGNLRQRFGGIYNRFTSAGVDPNTAKFFASIGALEGGGDVMAGGRTYDPNKTRHPGSYLGGKMFPTGPGGKMQSSTAAGPLQITQANWNNAVRAGIIDGNFANMANHVRVAQWLVGQRASQAIASGNYTQAIKSGAGQDWAALPVSTLKGRKQSWEAWYSLLGSNISPTQSVVNSIRSELPKEEVKKRFHVLFKDATQYQGNLSGDELNAISTRSDGYENVQQFLDAITKAEGFKKFAGIALPNDDELKAITNLEKQLTSGLDDINGRETARKIRAHQSAMIQYIESQKLISDYEDELGDFESGITTDRQLTTLSILKDRTANLGDRNSSEFAKVTFEAEQARAQRFYDLRAEGIRLENEEYYRQNNIISYILENAAKFNNEQLSKKQQIQDTNEQLYQREAAWLDQNSQYRKNLIDEELTSRRESRQSLEEEIEALTRYQSNYLGSIQQRKDFERQALRDRLQEHNDTLDEIIKSEIRVTNMREGLEVRLAARVQQIREERAKEFEQTLIRQIELEEEFRRKSDAYDPDKFRIGALENINSRMKTQTELMTDVFNDSFNSISEGFGGLVDKMTSRMGVFGNVVGNLLKGVFNNILGRISKNALDILSPQNIKAKEAESSTSGTFDILNVGVQNIAGASTAGANAVNYLASAAVSAGQALLAIAGQVGSTAAGIGSLITSGGRGGSPSAIGNVATSGIAGLSRIGTGLNTFGGPSLGGITIPRETSFFGSGSIAPTTPPFVPPSQTVSGQGSGNEYLDMFLKNGYPSGSGGSAASKGGLGALFSGLGIKNMGTSLLAGLPALGSGLGGMLGGPSVIGQGLGSIGGLIGGGVGLGVIGAIAGSTGLGGIFGTGGALAAFGGLSAATLGIGAAIAGAFLVGSWLFGRSKRRAEEKKKVNELSNDAVKQLQELLKSVRTDKVDGDEAISRAEEIRQQYMEQISQLKTGPGKKLAQQKLTSIDSLITQIKSAAAAQTRRREVFESIVPTYAVGGQTDTQLIRVSRGETLYSPETIPYMKDAFRAAGIPGLSGQSYYTKNKFGKITIPGRFDAKDDILMRVPVGTVIATPRHEEKIRARGYNSGGQVSVSAAPAAQSASISVQPPVINAIIVMDEKEAAKLGAKIPNSVIVNKTINHVKSTGLSGLAGVIGKELTGY